MVCEATDLQTPVFISSLFMHVIYPILFLKASLTLSFGSLFVVFLVAASFGVAMETVIQSHHTVVSAKVVMKGKFFCFFVFFLLNFKNYNYSQGKAVTNLS